MLVTTLLASVAAAGTSDLCAELHRKSPQLETVQGALLAGVDPDARCHWTAEVPLISTPGGLLFAILVPPVGIPLGIVETVTKKRSAPPLELAVGHRSEALVDALIDAGATPYTGAVEHAVSLDAWSIVERLVAIGADPALHSLSLPLAGDLERLERATAAGVQLSEVFWIGESWTLRTDPTVATAFVDAGVPPSLLLPEAADVGGAEVVAVLLPLVDVHGEPAYDAMREAVEDRRWSLVEQLIAGGVPLEPPDGRDAVLCQAVVDGSRSAVGRLLELGADPEGEDHWDSKALTLSVRRGRSDLARLLLEAGADPQRALPTAIAEGDTPMSTMLIEAGAQLDHPAVMRAALRAPGTRAVQRLLDAGVDPSVRVSGGQSWTVAAVEADRVDLLAVLVQEGAPIDGGTGASPLQAAIETREVPLIREVVALGADPRALPDPARAWDRAAWDDDAFAMLVELGVHPTPTVFREAVSRGTPERVQLLLANGADPLARDRFDRLPIEAASSAEMQDLLVAHGARPTQEMIERLWRAGDRERIEALLDASGALGLFDGDLLEDAVRAGDTEGAAWLLEHGANPNDPGTHGTPPLWLAVERGSDACITLLLQAGATADHPVARRNLLMVAVEADRPQWIGPLVDAGAELQTEDAWYSPMAAALRDDSQLAIDALLEAGHPMTVEVVQRDAWDCALDRLRASRASWPDALDEASLKRAARRAGCGREVRRLIRGLDPVSGAPIP